MINQKQEDLRIELENGFYGQTVKRRITRYIPFFRFVDFLKNGLFVPNTTLFEDRWEGKILHKNSLKKYGANPDFEVKFINALSWVHVSCWYNDAKENYLLWKAYGKNTEAVRIETTREKLIKAYRESSHFFAAYVDVVKYCNYEDEQRGISLPSFIGPFTNAPPLGPDGLNYVNIMSHLFVKYDPYHGENEIRLVCLNKNYVDKSIRPLNGIRIQIPNLEDFIESIVLAPGSPDIVHDTVLLVLNKFAPNLKDKVRRSQLEYLEC